MFKDSKEQCIVIAEASSNYEVYRFNNMALEKQKWCYHNLYKEQITSPKKLTIPIALGGFYLLLNKWKIHADKTITKESGNQTISFCLI